MRRLFLLPLATAFCSGAAGIYTYKALEQKKHVEEVEGSPHTRPNPLYWAQSYCKENLEVDKRTLMRNGHDGSSGELKKAIDESRRALQRLMVEQGIPGAVVTVSKDGCVVWSEGVGLADVENEVPCTPKSVMRIASISKSLTAVGLLQLHQKNLVDLDLPIQTYVPEFPKKSFEGEEVDVSLRMLLSHLGGVRHYKKKSELKEGKKEFENNEYYIQKHYSSVKDSIKLFSEDDLVNKPGKHVHTDPSLTLLTESTASLMLTPAVKDTSSGKMATSSSPIPPVGYAMGWFVREGRKGLANGRDYPFLFSHTGGAVGASSVLTIIPSQSHVSTEHSVEQGGSDTHSCINQHKISEDCPPDTHIPLAPPRGSGPGVVVAVLFNLQEVRGVFNLGIKIAEEFLETKQNR